MKNCFKSRFFFFSFHISKGYDDFFLPVWKFIHLLNKYLLNNYREANTVLGVGDADVNKRGKVLDLMELVLVGGRQINK